MQNKPIDYTPMFSVADYIQPVHFFYSSTGKLPNKTAYYNIDLYQLIEDIKSTFKVSNDQIFFDKQFLPLKKTFVLRNVMMIVRPEIMVYLYSDSGSSHVEILSSDGADSLVLEDLNLMVKDHIKDDYKQNKISLIYRNRSDFLSIKKFIIKKIELDIETNYNKDFKPIHDTILKKLNDKNANGIVLLHGLPGTGKTTYIRYLSSVISKRMIYLSPAFAHEIGSPEFISLMIDYPDSIIVIEDAENIIRDRISGDNLSVANLLNISDGLLSDCLNIQVICTFNTDISKIDKALLRKGRIIAKYEFKELNPEKAKNLALKLGIENDINKPKTLAEIYHMKEQNFQEPLIKKIGFK